MSEPEGTDSEPEPFEDSGSEYQPDEGIIGTPEISDTDTNTEENPNSEQNNRDNVPENENHESFESAESPDSQLETTKKQAKKTRKRKADPTLWKRNIRKVRRQAGQEYMNSKGEGTQKREPKEKCVNCRFKCRNNFTEAEIGLIHKEFWENSDSNKNHFYSKTTDRMCAKRKRNRGERKREKKFSYKYFLYKEGKNIRMCKKFYLGVLNISQIRILYFYEHKRKGITETPTEDRRGEPTKPKIPEEIRQSVRDHINLFPRLPSHYCRKETSREYLERTLSLAKMYDLYLEYCNENSLTPPAKKWLYYYIFNYEFNIGFQTPKKDLCDVCEEYELHKNEENLTEALEQKYRTHIKAKEAAREEKRKDAKNYLQDETTAVVCFDMQSVLTCPQTQISKAYYKKKFAVYNLTGYEIMHKQGYCMIWPETMGGRKGEDIASIVYVLLEKVIGDRPQVKSIILWSDACVPQNKNSHMSTALLYFLKMHPNVTNITQKFQVPGHSCVQEVDAMHSVLDRNLIKLELHSPLAIFKAIVRARTRKPYKVVQLNLQHFVEFKKMSQYYMVFSSIPYTKLTEISYENGSNYISFQLGFSCDTQRVCILKATRNTTLKDFLQDIPSPQIQALPPPLPRDKILHIKCLSQHFSKVDLQFWKTLIKDF